MQEKNILNFINCDFNPVTDDRSQMKRKLPRVAIGIVLALALTSNFTVAQAAMKKPAQAQSAKDVGGLNALIKLAKKEGELNVIALPDYWANYGNIIKKFSEKYGIKVNSYDPEELCRRTSCSPNT